MADKDFNHLHKWFGIPLREQPPHYYRLLGIDLFETDDTVINTALNQRVRTVRDYQAGEHAEACAELLDLLADVHDCLFDPEARAAYDAQLRRHLNSARPAAPPTPVAPPTPPASVGFPAPSWNPSELEFEPAGPGPAFDGEAPVFNVEVGDDEPASRRGKSWSLVTVLMHVTLSASMIGGFVYWRSLPKPGAAPVDAAGIEESTLTSDRLDEPGQPTGKTRDSDEVEIRPASEKEQSPRAASVSRQPAAASPANAAGGNVDPLVASTRNAQGNGEKVPGAGSKKEAGTGGASLVGPRFGDANDAVNLLPHADITTNAIQGKWATSKEGWLVSSDVGLAQIVAAGAAPDNYDLKVRVTRRTGWRLLIGLPVRTRHCAVEVTDDGIGLANINGQPPVTNGTLRKRQTLPMNIPVEITCRVRNNRIMVQVGSQLAIDWLGKDEQLALHAIWSKIPTGAFFIATDKSRFEVERWEAKRVGEAPAGIASAKTPSNTAPGVTAGAANSPPASAAIYQAPAPVPSAERQAALRQSLARQFDINSAHPPVKKGVILKRLLAARTPVCPRDEFYVISTLAIDLAREMGDFGAHEEAVKGILDNFEAPAWSYRARSIEAYVADHPTTIRLKPSMPRLIELAVAAAEEDRYADALKLLDAGENAIKQVKVVPVELRQALSEAHEDVVLREQHNKAYQQALKTQTVKPEDEFAQYTVGRWLAIFADDWDTALDHLSNGRNSDWKAAAVRELKVPTDAAEQVAVGDAWWGLGEKEPRFVQQVLRLHAGEWYDMAKAGLPIADQTRVGARLVTVAMIRKRLHREEGKNPGGTSPVADSAGPLGQRMSAESRAAAVRSGGGSEESEMAVASGLKWLAKMQKPDGHWDFKVPGDEKDGKEVTMVHCTSGATAMALLAYLGAGHTHRNGDYQVTVQKGLDYLVNQMQVTSQGGDLRGQVISHEGMYTQGLATLAICEAFALTKDARLKKIVKQAMDFIISAQDLNGGGWRYLPGQAGDTSVTGWQIMALKTAQLGKISVPPSTVGKATFFLNSMQAEGGARYGYLKPEDNNPTMTAVGLLSRVNLGWTLKTPALQKGVEYLGKVGPSPDNIYYNYYATQVLHHCGGDPWAQWNLVMRDRLVSSQVRQGDLAGSWPPTDPHATAGGRLYQTCLSIMTLEVYYRHVPLYQREKMSADF